MMCLEAEPNAAHNKLSELEKSGKLKAVVTQNIDGLHQKAGNKTVYELHGSIHRNYCMKCKKFYDAKYVKNQKGIPYCECGGIIKPDVVLYEEGLDGNVINAAIRAIASADTLIIGGTSLVVYPAASFIDYFHGKHLVVINKLETGKAVNAELSINATIGEIMSGIKIK
ncbi:MAG: NAD-dependent protein deacylase, partial [Lachnospiraceae bacterium]